MNAATSVKRTPQAKNLLDAVESVREVVEAGAAEAEDIKTLPKATVDAMNDLGLFRMKLPSAFVVRRPWARS